MFLTAANLSVPHGFFMRMGGVSEGVYSSLNCGWGTNDALANVRENRERVARSLGTDEKRLLSLRQVHGDGVVTVKAPWVAQDRPEADAMVTAVSGIALGILTADCVPVLLADAKHGIIGAAHAGWKGARAGVIRATVAAMCALGAKPSSIVAAIGPCIGQRSYEVGRELRDAFAGFPCHFASATREGHFLFDVRGCVRALLAKAGVTDIEALEQDTYAEEERFFSFRRATHRQGPLWSPDIGNYVVEPERFRNTRGA